MPGGWLRALADQTLGRRQADVSRTRPAGDSVMDYTRSRLRSTGFPEGLESGNPGEHI